jgi:FkbM family methyltransferase
MKMNELQQQIALTVQAALKSKNRLPLDYFSWGRDKRHVVDNTEKMPLLMASKSRLKDILRPFYRYLVRNKVDGVEKYSQFNASYLLMSDEYSRNLFVELLAMQLLGEKRMCLSSFTKDLTASYELASDHILKSQDLLKVYKWILKKITLTSPAVSFFTAPEILNIAYLNRLYCYKKGGVLIDVEEGDTVIDAGIGWGDTAVYLACKALSDGDGKYYAFDIVQEGMTALKKQLELNPHITNIVPIFKAVSDNNGEVFISDVSSPGSRVENSSTGRSIPSVTIDTFTREQDIKKVDFIKMDIEGSEVPALIGARETIKKYKPKLAISVYHKWDDLEVIPTLIHGMHPGYRFYLDCTTGFGGEAILYCH